ncbi:TM2 domain-containing protein [Candidatus Saccharibacteria bacterium]|nr:TM2 domain-containing protein [Candidatus Saccharibacteria bacterium]
MAEILKINEKEVKIGTDDGKVVTVPLSSVNYDNPREGDKVKVYKDGKDFIVTQSSSSFDDVYSTDAKGNKKINKHVFVWVGTFLLGNIGLDRFMRGQIGIGVCKILFGWLTLGIWYLVDWLIALSKAYGSAYGNVEDITFDKEGNYTR